MLPLVFVLFFACYFFCMWRKVLPLCICVFLFAFVLLHEVFGAFFFSMHSIADTNYWLFLFAVIYFYFWFFSFYWLGRYGLIGVLIHSAIMVLPSLLKVILPLHPFILLYPQYADFLPSTHISIFNLFILFFISGVFFCGSKNIVKLGVVFTMVCVVLLTNDNHNNERFNENIKIAVVQVGVYFSNGGNTTDFFHDLLTFIDKNPDIDSIVFSENNLFSFKNKYNKKITEKLLSDIKRSTLPHKYHVFLSLNGYREFNNIITLHLFKNDFNFNQKRVLIPFIEKPGILNQKNEINSDYYYIYNSHKNQSFNIMGASVSTYICYDALFPEIRDNSEQIILIQSNYGLLDKGYGHDRLKYFATYLAKFLNGMRSKVVINVQNHGGTVVLYDDWRIDHQIYESSKKAPFLIIKIKS
ncbi:TPA: hypothetical protein ACG31J_005129 [Escherichia coli]